MNRRALIISHADADGHLIAEQVRRNLELIPSFNVQTIVDPIRTKDHKVWKKLDEFQEINDADFIFFVDLMFAPKTFSEEARALVNFVTSRPTQKFFLMDHHPLPLRRLQAARNLRVMYRPDVFECAIGPRSGMMIVAALCERQFSAVADIRCRHHDILAHGMRRAAAHGGPLPGNKLMALLRADSWTELAHLGRDAPEHHRLPRGRRPMNQPLSKALNDLNETAESLLASVSNHSRRMTQPQPRRTAMAYDTDALKEFEIGQERIQYDAGRRLRMRNYRAHSKDLEAIVTLMEVAALSLTAEPDATFAFEDLVREIRDLSGDEITIDERDVKIVLEKATFLERVGPEFRLR